MIQNALQDHQKASSASESSVNPDVSDAQGPVKLTNISNVPITLKLTEDSKMVYDTIGRLAGINVLFDPDYTSRRLSVELNGSHASTSA